MPGSWVKREVEVFRRREVTGRIEMTFKNKKIESENDKKDSFSSDVDILG